MLVKRSVLNEIKNRNIHSRFQGLKQDQKEKLLQNFKRSQKLADKVNWQNQRRESVAALRVSI